MIETPAHSKLVAHNQGFSHSGAWAAEVRAGQRFKFGENWQRFLGALDDNRIAAAENGLRAMLGVPDLNGKSFLDVGSGSGLSSLAAMRLGASRVHSVDFDPQSVACTRQLRRQYYPAEENWIVEEGNILNRECLEKFGTFDVVYSWGVLHHTGHMWEAMENLIPLVAQGGKLFIAIYQDEGEMSRLWEKIKIFYNRRPLARGVVFSAYLGWQLARGLVVDVIVKRRSPFARYRNYKGQRGMSFASDLSDWLGGYPFEVAKPEEIFEFFQKRGFVLTKLKTAGRGHGNNEFVFAKLWLAEKVE